MPQTKLLKVWQMLTEWQNFQTGVVHNKSMGFLPLTRQVMTVCLAEFSAVLIEEVHPMQSQ